jgi:thiamine-monophosphate kinase
VSSLGERAVIDRLRRRFPAPPTPLVVDIGDDAAVVRPERNALQVLTTDALLDGVHFDRRFCRLRDVGYRALAVNVSDVAAMGGVARLALVSLMLPDDTTGDDVDELADGIAEMAAEGKVGIAGGNLTRTPGPLTVDVTVVGSVGSRRFLTRGGARAGDHVYVSGALGAAAAGLDWLRTTGAGPLDTPDDPALASSVARYRRPAPRARLGAILGRSRAARACMDLSDGLADAAHQVAEAGGTGVKLDAALIPIDPGARAWFASRGIDPLTAALERGDDYELLFAVPPKGAGRLRGAMRQARGLAVTRIGVLTREPGVLLTRDGTTSPLPSGFSHF